MASFDNSPFLRQKISTGLHPKPTSFSTGVFVRWSRSGFDPAPAVLFLAFHKASGFLRIAEAGPSRQLFRLFDYRPTHPQVGACAVNVVCLARPGHFFSFLHSTSRCLGFLPAERQQAFVVHALEKAP